MRCGLSGLGLIFVWVSAAAAQPAVPPTPRRTIWVLLNLNFDRRGDVWATLSLPIRPSNPAFCRQALGMALHTPLDQVREEKTRGSWSLHAHGGAVLRRRGWTVEGDVDLTSLQSMLDLLGAAQLTVSIEHPSADFTDCSLNDSPLWRNVLHTTYLSDMSVEQLPPVHLAFGFQAAHAWRFLPLAAVLLVPIVLTLWRRSRQFDSDRFTAWFQYGRFHRRLILTMWCAWFVGAAVLNAMPLADFVLCGIFEHGDWVWLALFLLLPPALTGLASRMLSAPAFARVPEVGWTRDWLFKQALWTQLGTVAIGVCAAFGLDAQVAAPTVYWAILWAVLGYVAAVGLLIVCIGGWFQSRNPVLNVLPPGELRQRLFELADQMQVRVYQVYSMPSAHWRLLNVVGALGECVHVTAEVLPHLSRREVDALLAMELARLWRRRRTALWRFLGYTLLIGIVGATVLTISAGLESSWLLLPLIFPLLLVLRSHRRGQHFSARLDRDTLAITGDPEALITALAKLRRLQMVPLVAGEEPSAAENALAEWPRLRNLADRAAIPPERLREILVRPGSGEDRYDPLPATAQIAPQADRRVFSRTFKQHALSRQNWTVLALEIATPALTAYLVEGQRWHGVWLILAYLAGLLLTVLFGRLAIHYFGRQTDHALQQGFRDKLAREGLTPDAWGGIFVGLAPHAEPRNYEGFLVWDVGFLMLIGDRLCYLGDRTRFALDRENIRDVYLGLAGPSRRIAQCVYLVWRDDEHALSGTFHLSASGRHGLWRLDPAAAKLAKRLRDWRQQANAPADIPAPLRELAAPEFGAVASESLGKVATGNILLAILLMRAPFAIGACFLLGLSFDRDAGAAGWYVLLTTMLLPVWTVLSFLRYRSGKQDDGDADAPASRRD